MAGAALNPLFPLPIASVEAIYPDGIIVPTFVRGVEFAVVFAQRHSMAGSPSNVPSPIPFSKVFPRYCCSPIALTHYNPSTAATYDVSESLSHLSGRTTRLRWFHDLLSENARLRRAGQAEDHFQAFVRLHKLRSIMFYVVHRKPLVAKARREKVM